MGRITVKDIAKLLGINPSTVSRALRDHPDISEATRKKVAQVASELGYTPNLQAISFRNRKSRLIGLIIPDMNMYFFPAVIQGIEQRVSEAGYNLILLHSDNSLESERENTLICNRLGVEGLLVSLSAESEVITHFEELTEQGVPVVLFDRVVDKLGFPSVIIDDKIVARQVVEHLINSGRNKICGVFGDPHLAICRLRRKGYEEALIVNGFTIRPEYIISAKEPQAVRVQLNDLLSGDDPPDAIFTMSDEVLVEAMRVCQKLQLRIPAEIAIATISNGEVPNFWYPRITYMQHSGHEVGSTAADILFQLINNKTVPHLNWISTRLVVQGST